MEYGITISHFVGIDKICNLIFYSEIPSNDLVFLVNTIKEKYVSYKLKIEC